MKQKRCTVKMKKALSLFLIFSMLLSSSIPIFADNSGAVGGYVEQLATELATEDESGEASLDNPIEDAELSLAAEAEWIDSANTDWCDPYYDTIDVFVLNSPEDLAGLAKAVNSGKNFAGKTVRLENNINLSGKNWTPIGTAASPFIGIFDGAEKSIEGLSSRVVGDAKTTIFAGLFGAVGSAAEIANLSLTVESVYAEGSGAAAGGLIGQTVQNGAVPEKGNVHNCHITINGEIKSNSANGHTGAGGVVGILYSDNAKMSDCFVTVAETGKIEAGFTESNASKGQVNVGGYVGYASTGTRIERSRIQLNGLIEVSAATVPAGVIKAIGGFVGCMSTRCSVTDSYALINETGKIRAALSTTTNLNGTSGIGAFLGWPSSRSNQISTSYVINRGSIESTDPGIPYGILAGSANSSLTVSNSYGYSSGTEGLFGQDNNITKNQVVKVSALEDMKKQSTYVGFDFATVWMMDSFSGYPIIGKEGDLTDEEVVRQVKTNLTFNSFKGSNTAIDSITMDLALPTTGIKDSVISWSSNDPEVISAEGKVTRQEQNKAVVLTATITRGSASDTKEFTVTVLASGEWTSVADRSWYDNKPTATSYTIQNERQLAGLAAMVNEGKQFAGVTFTLAANLNLAGKNWTPIGKNGAPFSGIFNGGKKTIEGLDSSVVTDAATPAFAGLFGAVSSMAEISHLSLSVDRVYAEGSGAGAGGLIGQTVQNGAVPKNGNVHDCYITVNGEINAASAYSHTGAGGAIGITYSDNALLRDCFVTVSRTGKITAGFTEANTAKSQINLGGYVGYASTGCRIERSRIQLAGLLEVDSSNNVPAGATKAIGGFVGCMSTRCVVSDCYAIIDATGKIRVNLNTTSNAGSSGIGAFLGWPSSAGNQIKTSYVVNTGSIASTDTGIPCGILAGVGNSSMTVSNCYGYSSGSEELFGLDGNIGKTQVVKVDTLEKMKQQSTFVGFDFATVWAMDKTMGYPVIATEGQLTDEEIVAQVKMNLTFNMFRGDNTAADSITSDLQLPTTGIKNSVISWSSNNPEVINNQGKVMPAETAKTVVLTATITHGAASDTKAFALTVLKSSQWIQLADRSWYETNPNAAAYTIQNEKQLAGLAALVNEGTHFSGKTITLAANLNLKGRNWTPIGTSTRLFLAAFDGGGKTITGLDSRVVTDVNTAAFAGLFGAVGSAAEISNLHLSVDRVYAEGSGAGAGGLIGQTVQSGAVPKNGNVHNCYITVVGEINAASANGHTGAGGAIGITYSNDALLRNCFVTVPGTGRITAGFTADNPSKSQINLGGYVGYASTGCRIEQSRIQLAGLLEVDSRNNVPEGALKAIGGFVGCMSTRCVVSDCYAIIESTGKIQVNLETTSNPSYSGVGAFMGWPSSAGNQIKTSYVVNTGSISSTDTGIPCGILAGNGSSSLTVSNCYGYSSGTEELFGRDNNISKTQVVKVDALNKMKQQATFAGFDFATVWTMDKTTGYPVISTESQLTDVEIVKQIKDNLTFNTIRGENTAATAITLDLSLPTTGLKESVISWSSSAPDVISAEGRVTRQSQDKAVVLTATITKGAASDTKAFALTVLNGAEWIQIADRSWYEDNPAASTYLIQSERQLAGLASLTNEGKNFAGKTITLAADLDLTGRNWTPIGTMAAPFMGVFDGDGKSIVGLSSQVVGNANTDIYAGLFGAAGSASEIKKLSLTVERVYAEGSGAAAGGLIGEIVAGGAVPKAGNIHDCYVTVNGELNAVSANGHTGAGGAVGITYADNVLLRDCFVTVTKNGRVTSGFTEGNVRKGQLNVGGYVGYASLGCRIERSRIQLAGLIDVDSATIPGEVSKAIGGFVGCMSVRCAVSDCYAIIEPTGKIQANLSSVNTGVSGIGAFLGWTSSTGNQISTSYVINRGGISSTDAAIPSGLLVGNGNSSMTVSNCYAYSAGSQGLFGQDNNITKSQVVKVANLEDMKKQATFAGFDFAMTWIMDKNTGYPVIGTEAELTDAEIVARVKDSLTFDLIKGSNESASSVSKDLVLPTSGLKECAISWSSNLPEVISAEGKVTPQQNDTKVVLTATISHGAVTDTKAIEVTVSQATEWSSIADRSWYDSNSTGAAFTIENENQLAGLAALVNAGNSFAGKTITLSKDLDLTGRNWTPIGTAASPFKGTFKGGRRTIVGLDTRVVGDAKTTIFAGLFGAIGNAAEIGDLSLVVERVYAEGSGAAAGGLVGQTIQGGTIPEKGNVHDCHITVNGEIKAVSASGHMGAGGVIGITYSDYVTMRDCFVTVASTGRITAGFTATSTGKGQVNVGGYVGYGSTGCTIERSRILLNGEIVVNDAEVPAGVIKAIGGFIGCVSTRCTISDCYTIIESTGKIRVDLGTTTNLGGSGGIGGFMGWPSSSGNQIKTSYVINQGTIESTDTGIPCGLLVGSTNASLVISHAYAYSSGPEALFGQDANSTKNQVVKVKTLEEMKQQSTYSGFDFATVWIMDQASGYPIIGTETKLTDEEVMKIVYDELTFDVIKGGNNGPDKIIGNLELLTSAHGAELTWESSNPNVISNTGVVSRGSQSSVEVTLTATIKIGELSRTKQITVTVIPKIDWDAFWTDYWRSHDKVTWTTVGDSITASNMRYSKGYKQYYDWVEYRLNAELGKDVTVINPSYPSYTLDHYNTWLDNWAIQYKPDIVTVHFGMNNLRTDVDSVKGTIDSILNRLIPSPENVAAGAPEDRVVVLVACHPENPATDGMVRKIHQYGQTRAEELTGEGYRVQYIDGYEYFISGLQYGKDGNLGTLSNYRYDGMHINEYGHYALAQCMMQEMGLYDANSVACNIPHNTLHTQPLAPMAALDYSRAKKKTDGSSFATAKTTTGFTSFTTKQEEGSMLILGGEATSGTHTSAPEYRNYGWLLQAFSRSVGPYHSYVEHKLIVKSDRKSAQAYSDTAALNEAVEKIPGVKYVLYMPEINELYKDGYVHSAAKVDAYGRMVGSVADKCAAKGIDFTILTPFPMADDTKDACLRQYVQKLEEVAEAKGLSISNLYGVFRAAMDASPQIARNWYTADGYPNYIAQVEAAKTFLGGSEGIGNGTYLFPYTYRNTSTTSGTQQDNFMLKPRLKGNQVVVELSELLTDPLYSGMAANAGNFSLEKIRGTAVTPLSSAFESGKKTLSYEVADVADGDQVRLKVTNGSLVTYLKPFTNKDINKDFSAAELQGTAVYGNTLTAGAITPQEATVSYAWYRGSGQTPIATGATYKITKEDIGKTITLVISGTGQYTSEFTFVTGVVAKADGAESAGELTAVAPTSTANRDGKIRGLNPAAVYEYKLQSAASYTKAAAGISEITGLVPGTYQVRIAETATHKASGNSVVEISAYQAAVITGTVVINGTTVIGETLQAKVQDLKPAGATVRYQWYRGATAIANANGASYQLTKDDVGKQMKVEVNGYGEFSGKLTSDSTTEVRKQNGPAAPTGLTGVAPTAIGRSDGKITGLSAGTAYEYKQTGETTYRQISGAAEITGLAAGYYQVRIKETDTKLASEDTIVIVSSGKNEIMCVGIEGTAKYGETLRSGAITPANATVAYEWTREGVADPIATGKTYTLVKADIGKVITLTIKGLGEYSGTLTFNSPAVAKADGAESAGSLTAKTPTSVANTDGKITGLNRLVAYEYKLQGEESYKPADAGNAEITNLVPGTYLVRIAETETHMASKDTTVEISAFEAVEITGTLSITGSAIVGGTLTAEVTNLSPAAATVSYQWYRGDAEIEGATSKSYLVTEADAGTMLSVRVLGTGNYAGQLTSEGVQVPETAQGVTVAGIVKGYNTKYLPAVILIQDGVTVATAGAVEAVAVSGNQFVQRSFTFEFEGIVEGVYELKIMKEGHLPVTVKNVVVGSEVLDLTQDSREAVRTLELPCGNLILAGAEADDVINIADKNLIANVKNWNKKVDTANGPENPYADLNGDGVVNIADKNLVANLINWNKRPLIIE